MILTEKAISETKKIIAEQNVEKAYLRVGCKGGGCSGFSYLLALDDKYDDKKDILEEHDGVKVVVDRRSSLYLNGVTLDFHEGIDKRGFKFDNPNATGTCGCGSSFSM